MISIMSSIFMIYRNKIILVCILVLFLVVNFSGCKKNTLPPTGNKNPTVTLISPLNATQIHTKDSLFVKANASDDDGIIRTYFKPNDGERYFRRQARRRAGT